MMKQKLVIGLALIVSTFALTSARASVIDGKLFYANTDCGFAKNWPTATPNEPIASEGRDCEATLSVDANGDFTYSVEQVTFKGYAKDLVGAFGKVKGIALYFETLKGSYYSLGVNKEGTALSTSIAGFTFATSKPLISGAVAGKNYVARADRGIANNWFKGTMSTTGVRVNVLLAFNENGHFTYTTTDQDNVLEVQEHGKYKVVGRELRLTFDVNEGKYMTATLQNDTIVLVRNWLAVKLSQ
jgi:hypothetical protein